jgi:hypothetical protein
MASKIKLVTGETIEVDQSRDQIAELLANRLPVVTVSRGGTERDVVPSALVYIEDIPADPS